MFRNVSSSTPPPDESDSVPAPPPHAASTEAATPSATTLPDVAHHLRAGLREGRSLRFPDICASYGCGTGKTSWGSWSRQAGARRKASDRECRRLLAGASPQGDASQDSSAPTRGTRPGDLPV